MQFLYSAELRPGLRIAKPIYNKDGVLLYERNARLTVPAINSITSLGLTGIYILEPAEPVASFTTEDLEFERTQTIYLFKLRDLFEKIYKRQPLDQLEPLVEDIIKHYGKANPRINFNQNARTSQDFMYKHATSTAILCATIGQHINMSEENFKTLIGAAVLYTFGYRFIHKNNLDKQSALEKGTVYLNTTTSTASFLSKAARVAEYFILSRNPERNIEHPTEDILLLSEILKVSAEFDILTSMAMHQGPQSEIVAINALRERTKDFNINIVNILAHCIHIVPAGATVNLNNREKGVVLVENTQNYMQPIILRLRDGNVYDLSNPSINNRIYIEDLIKTEDNRIEIDLETVKIHTEKKDTPS